MAEWRGHSAHTPYITVTLESKGHLRPRPTAVASGARIPWGSHSFILCFRDWGLLTERYSVLIRRRPRALRWCPGIMEQSRGPQGSFLFRIPFSLKEAVRTQASFSCYHGCQGSSLPRHCHWPSPGTGQAFNRQSLKGLKKGGHRSYWPNCW